MPFYCDYIVTDIKCEVQSYNYIIPIIFHKAIFGQLDWSDQFLISLRLWQIMFQILITIEFLSSSLRSIFFRRKSLVYRLKMEKSQMAELTLWGCWLYPFSTEGSRSHQFGLDGQTRHAIRHRLGDRSRGTTATTLRCCGLLSHPRILSYPDRPAHSSARDATSRPNCARARPSGRF